MARLRRLVEDGLGDREAAGLGVRQPLREATVHGRPLSPELEAIFADELNVKAVAYTAHGDDEHEGVTLDTVITDDLRLEGLVRNVSRKVNDLRKQAGLALDERIRSVRRGRGRPPPGHRDPSRSPDGRGAGHRDQLRSGRGSQRVVGEDRRRAVLAGREPLSAGDMPQVAPGAAEAPGATPVPAISADVEPGHADAPDVAPARRQRLRSKPRRYAIMVITAVAVGAIDHLTKWLVVNHVRLDTQVPAGSPVTIHYIQNSGAAFGLFPQFTFLYLVVAAIVAGYILVYGPRMGGGLLRLLALGGILGGSISNGIDRLISGSVVDFIDFHFWLFQIFNVADMAIVGGMLVVVYQLGFRNDSVASE